MLTVMIMTSHGAGFYQFCVTTLPEQSWAFSTHTSYHWLPDCAPDVSGHLYISCNDRNSITVRNANKVFYTI